jgi:hypothetical protein
MKRNFYNLLASGSTPSRRGILDYAPEGRAHASWSLLLGENQSAFCGHSLGKPHGMIPTFQSDDLEALDRLGQSPLLVIPMYSVLGSETEKSHT